MSTCVGHALALEHGYSNDPTKCIPFEAVYPVDFLCITLAYIAFFFLRRPPCGERHARRRPKMRSGVHTALSLYI